MERRALEPVRLEPVDGPGEDVGPVVVEPVDDARVHLDPRVVEHAHAAREVLGRRRALACVAQVVAVERLKPDENAGAPGTRHRLHEGRIVGDVDRDRGGPDPAQRCEQPAELREVGSIRAQVVVDEDDVRLVQRGDLVDDALRVAELARIRERQRGEVAEPAAVVAAARRDDAPGRQEGPAVDDLAARDRRVVERGRERTLVARLQGACRGVGQDPRPGRHAVADRDRVGVRGCFFGAGRDVQAAEHHARPARPVPAGERVGTVREREVDGDADDRGKGIERRRPLQQVLVPVPDGPPRRGRGRETRQRVRRRQHVLAETRPGVLRVERVEEEHRARVARARNGARIEEGSDDEGPGETRDHRRAP